MMEYLPRDIILDILSRLPITSLLQFKLVCKAWLNLAQDPLLVSRHFFRTSDNDPCLIMHCDYPIQNQLYSLELSDNKEDQRVKKIRVPMLSEFEIKGSCKGLLFLCDALTKFSLFVYNPFTRKHIELPKSNKELYDEIRVFGFGFNSTKEEYKVVKIFHRRPPIRYDQNIVGAPSSQSEVQVFTLGGTAWKSLEKIPYHLSDQGPSQAFVSGRLHWSTCPGSYQPGCLLISFDLEDDQFREVPKPDSVALERYSFDLVDLRGFLSVILRNSFGGIVIWIMKEYGVKESWIKKFRIGMHFPRGWAISDLNTPQMFNSSKFFHKSSNIKVVGLLKNGKLLLEHKCRALLIYDQKDATFKDLEFPRMPYWFEAFLHEGTLSWIETLLSDT